MKTLGNKKKNYKEEQLNYSLTYDDVVRIMKMIDDHEYSNLNIELGDLKLEINKEKDSTSTSTSQESQVSQAGITVEKPVEEAPKVKESEPTTKKEEVPEEKEAEQPKEDASEEGLVSVKTPITGVFYEAPSPEEPPFVQVGSEVKKGDELGLIEVMKLFNSLTAPCDGVVKEILVENESIVETGEVLMVIEPS